MKETLLTLTMEMEGKLANLQIKKGANKLVGQALGEIALDGLRRGDASVADILSDAMGVIVKATASSRGVPFRPTKDPKKMS